MLIPLDRSAGPGQQALVHTTQICLLLLLLAPGVAANPCPPAPPSGEGSLAAEVRDRFAAIEADPVPKAITNNKHYVISNEGFIHLFEPTVRDLGGVMVGVGTDQMYTMAGWSRPQVLVLLDFDQMIVDLHAAYEAFFASSADPQAFVALWAKGHGDAARASIEERWRAAPERLQRALAAFRYAREKVHRRLLKVQRKSARYAIPSFVSDADQYAFVRGLYAEGRVVAVRGDLLATNAMAQTAAAARASGLTVRVMYLSNTEMYFNYNKAFKANLLALPVDGRSVIIRTMPIKPVDYMYIVQSAYDLHTWLRTRGTGSVWGMYKTRRRVRSDPHRGYVIDALPRKANVRLDLQLAGGMASEPERRCAR